MTFCEQQPYGGWQQAHRIGNDHLEMVVVSEIGPRIMYLGLLGSHNLFRNLDQDLGQTGGEEFRLYGGQRLWAAPENADDTYYPDNIPAEFRQLTEHVFEATAPVERTTGLQKQMRIELAQDRASAAVIHTISNQGADARELSPWALSVMNLHGMAIVPLPPFGSHAENLAPVSPLALWAYTDLTDPRWTVGSRHVLLQQDPLAGHPQKLGLSVGQGWAAYWLDSVLFVKTFGYDSAATYPDFGCNVEIFTDHRILEVESLGPLTAVAPGQSVSQTEEWHLFPKVAAPTNDREVETYVMPHVEAALQGRA